MSVGIKYINTGMRASQYWVEGTPEEVTVDVADRLNRDKVVPMYEHMRLKIIAIDIAEFPTKLRICLYKSLYAGD